MRNELQCLDAHKGGCEGDVEMRSVDMVKWFPRCDKHFRARLVEQERIVPLLSDTPPDWFDPLAAGEKWDEDE